MTHSSKHTASSKPTSIPKPVAKDTPVSPNKGTAVFRSYKLRHHTMETEDPKTTETSQNTTEPENMANEVRHLNVPTGNATRPPPPDKYKKWKFQIDKVRYYSCMYCNKHFDSIHHLNNHHRCNHPPVSCDICNKIYNTPNSLIRHSYKHLDGLHKCDKCMESFHFKSELESHKMKHSQHRFYCKNCGKGFILNSDLNVNLDTHGDKWKCPYEGCNKECANK